MSKQDNEVDFFGIKLKVNNSKLAAMLSSNAVSDVVVLEERPERVSENEDKARVAGNHSTVFRAVPRKAFDRAPDELTDDT